MLRSHALINTILLALALLTLPATAQSTRVYKWLDAQGNVHYSDHLPSDPQAKEREILNPAGIAIGRLDVTRMSPAAAAQRQEVLRNAQRDTALAVSFESEDQLRRAQEERIGLVRNGLAIARANTERLQQAHAQHESHARALKAQGQPVPLRVQENVEQARRMLDEQVAETAKLEQRYEAMLLSQADEVARWRELAKAR
jgi:hypothetical protein